MENHSYNHIAKDYHLKRKKPWYSFENFLNYLKNKGYLFKGYSVDLGCANGRHFILLSNSDNRLIGIDNTLAFLQIAREKLKDKALYSQEQYNKIQLILGDFTFLPIRAKKIQNVFSIATLHHGRSNIERKKAMFEIHDVLTNNGFLFLTLWRRWQKKYKKFFFIDWFKRSFSRNYKNQQKKAGLREFGDKIVPWKVSSEKKTYNRFYHFFSKRELKKITKHFQINELKKFGGPNKKDNFFILAQK